MTARFESTEHQALQKPENSVGNNASHEALNLLGTMQFSNHASPKDADINELLKQPIYPADKIMVVAQSDSNCGQAKTGDETVDEYTRVNCARERATAGTPLRDHGSHLGEMKLPKLDDILPKFGKSQDHHSPDNDKPGKIKHAAPNEQHWRNTHIPNDQIGSGPAI